MEKILGCAKNHSKEIDLYEKTYAEKIERVTTMMQQAQKALENASQNPISDLEPEETEDKGHESEV